MEWLRLIERREVIFECHLRNRHFRADERSSLDRNLLAHMLLCQTEIGTKILKHRNNYVLAEDSLAPLLPCLETTWNRIARNIEDF